MYGISGLTPVLYFTDCRSFSKRWRQHSRCLQDAICWSRLHNILLLLQRSLGKWGGDPMVKTRRANRLTGRRSALPRRQCSGRRHGTCVEGFVVGQSTRAGRFISSACVDLILFKVQAPGGQRNTMMTTVHRPIAPNFIHSYRTPSYDVRLLPHRAEAMQSGSPTSSTYDIPGGHFW